jgi:hypothetical protein
MSANPPLERLSRLDALLWQRAQDRNDPLSLSQALREAYEDMAPDQLTVWTVCSSVEDPGKRLAGVAGGLGLIAETLGSTQLLWVPDPKRGNYVVGIWPTQATDTYHLVGTVPVTDPRWRRVEQWVNRASPKLFVPYLTEREFAGILDSLGEHGDTAVSRISARTYGVYSTLGRTWPTTGRHKTRPSHQEVLSELRGVAFPRTILMEVIDRLSLHLRRDSGATFYAGDFGLFEHIVMGGFALAGENRRLLLSNRQRTHQQSPARPIRIQLASDAFDAPNAVDLLVDALSQPNSSVAVLHRNPYIHIALTNYLDGSNADAFVFEADELMLYPGFAASAGALARLTAAITDRFAAIEVSEGPSPARPTLEELLTTG